MLGYIYKKLYGILIYHISLNNYNKDGILMLSFIMQCDNDRDVQIHFQQKPAVLYSTHILKCIYYYLRN